MVMDISEIRRLSQASVQEFPDATGGFGHFVISLAAIGDVIPAWGETPIQRDQALRTFYPTEYWVASTVSSLAARNGAFSWTVEGPPRTCDRIQEALHVSEYGDGWVPMMEKTSTDLYTQDNGAFIEVIRDGKGPSAPFLGLAHLDAARCQRTGNKEYPVIYTDRQGNMHKMAWYQIATIEDMPSPVETMNGMQMCALSRVLRAAQIMRDVAMRTQEKLTGRFAGALHIVSGITAKMIQDAMAQAQEESQTRGRMRYQPPIIAGTLDPSAEVKVATIPLADIPESWHSEEERKWFIAVLALGFGCEYQDLAPLPGGNLGSSQQSEILHLKAKGRGPELFQKLFTHALNFKILPESVTFKFDEKDFESERIEATVKQARAEAIKIYIESGAVTPEVARQMMEDDGDLKHEYLEMMQQDVTGDQVSEDEGRQQEVDEGVLPDGGILPDDGLGELEKQLKDPAYWERQARRFEREMEEEATKLLEDIGERVRKRLTREIR